jgi:hypothetical protein
VAAALEVAVTKVIDFISGKRISDLWKLQLLLHGVRGLHEKLNMLMRSKILPFALINNTSIQYKYNRLYD